MSRITTVNLFTDTRGAETLQEEAVPSHEAQPEEGEYTSRHPQLPKQIERLRGQKICSYCKHSIEEDPYFVYESYWQRVLQNKSYLLRQIALELTLWAAGVFYFLPKFKARLLYWKDHILLPGWVRCANPDCGQLYHASCWQQINKTKGCLRCRTNAARRVN